MMMFSYVAADGQLLIITARWASLHAFYWMLQAKIQLLETMVTSNQGS